MANNVVAFIGIESFDIILYLSRILCQLGRNVLIADHTDQRALTHSIPQMQGIDPETNIITYRHVDFTAQRINSILANQYDDILIDCGCNGIGFDPELITCIIYVTDLYGFHLVRISALDDYSHIGIKQKLLVREVVATKYTAEDIVNRINKRINSNMISVLYRDDLDYQNGVLCQNNQYFSFLRISRTFRKYLLREVYSLYPQLSKKQIKSAYYKSQKG